MKKFYLLLLLVGLFAISCETSDEVLEDVTDNKTEQPGDDAGDGTGNGISDKEREEIVTKIFEELAFARIVTITENDLILEMRLVMLQFVFNIHTLRVKLILLRFLRRDKCRRISHCRLSVCQSRILILLKPVFNA